MSETKELLRRGVGGFEPMPDALDRVFERRERKRRNQRVAAGALGIAVFAIAAIAFVRLAGSEGTPATEPTEVPSPEPTTSGGMWPQSSLEEIRQAQERADAGDPDYTWQLDPQLVEFDDVVVREPGQVEIADRFLHEVLGWEAYTMWDIGQTTERPHNIRTDQRYLRCAPGRVNPLYPDEPCAPTIDELHYESVSIDLAQLVRQGDDGVWVVTGWELTAPFAQSDPAPLEARATGYLEEFLAARIAGDGAEVITVQVDPESTPVPLLYATSSGARYERYEIERVDGPRWPYGGGTLRVRLFADGDATVVEQDVRWFPDGTLSLAANTTTENGQPVVLPHTSSDGEVTVSAPSTWAMWWPEAAHVADVGVWFGGLWRSGDLFGSGERVEFVDPVAYDAWCGAAGGSPLLSGPANAASIAQQVVADPNFESSDPVAARVGGLDAVMMDVALAPGGESCGIGMIIISRWIHELWDPGLRLRLYLVDLPEAMSVETLAITVVAPEKRFDEVIDETARIIDSIEFHAP